MKNGQYARFAVLKYRNPPKTIDEFLKEFVDEYGPSIFKEENCNRLDRYMGDWPEIYADDRDVIKLLQIKNIPSRLSSALDIPAEEQGAVLREPSKILAMAKCTRPARLAIKSGWRKT